MSDIVPANIHNLSSRPFSSLYLDESRPESRRPTDLQIWNDIIEIGKIIVRSPNGISYTTAYGNPSNMPFNPPKSQTVMLEKPNSPFPYFAGKATLSPDIKLRHLTAIEYYKETPGAGEYPTFTRFDANLEASANGWVTLTVNPEAYSEALEFEEPDRDLAAAMADESSDGTYVPRNAYLYMPNAFNQVQIAGPLDVFGPKTIAFVEQFTLEALLAFRLLTTSLSGPDQGSLQGENQINELGT